MEKEDSKKVSHSAIERRRREKINDRISTLRQIVPNMPQSSHKLDVLESTIAYIQQLQLQLKQLETQVHLSEYPSPVLSCSSAETLPADALLLLANSSSSLE